MNWLDLFLSVCLLGGVPFALAAYGGHLAAEIIPDAQARRRSKAIFWSLCVVGIAVATVYQYRSGRTEEARSKIAIENETSRKAAEQEAKQAQSELADSEKRNSQKLLHLQG
jgi:hypothetical protein